MIKIKKILWGLSVVAANASFAGSMGDANLTNYPKEGLYAGLGVGGSFNNDALDLTATSGQLNLKKSSDQWVGTILAGYGYTFTNSLFLGVEASTTFPHRTQNIYTRGIALPQVTFLEQYSIKDYLGLDLLPGYRVNSNVLIYGRAGLAFRDIYFNQPENNALSEAYFNSTNQVGGRFGAGIAYALNTSYFYRNRLLLFYLPSI